MTNQNTPIATLAGSVLAVIDTETTGVNPTTARVVTATILLVGSDGRIRAEHNWLVNPGVPIPERATEIHGVSDAHAKAHGADPAHAIDQINTVLNRYAEAGIPVVAYNAMYDLSLLANEAARHSVTHLTDFPLVIDPMLLDRTYNPGRPGGHTLGNVAQQTGVPLSAEDAHDARNDALATARVAHITLRQVSDLHPGMTASDLMVEQTQAAHNHALLMTGRRRNWSNSDGAEIDDARFPYGIGQPVGLLPEDRWYDANKVARPTEEQRTERLEQLNRAATARTANHTRTGVLVGAVSAKTAAHVQAMSNSTTTQKRGGVRTDPITGKKTLHAGVFGGSANPKSVGTGGVELDSTPFDITDSSYSEYDTNDVVAADDAAVDAASAAFALAGVPTDARYDRHAATADAEADAAVAAAENEFAVIAAANAMEDLGDADGSTFDANLWNDPEVDAIIDAANANPDLAAMILDDSSDAEADRIIADAQREAAASRDSYRNLAEHLRG